MLFTVIAMLQSTDSALKYGRTLFGVAAIGALREFRVLIWSGVVLLNCSEGISLPTAIGTAGGTTVVTMDKIALYTPKDVISFARVPAIGAVIVLSHSCVSLPNRQN